MYSTDSFWERQGDSLQSLKNDLQRSKNRNSGRAFPSYLPQLETPPESPRLRGRNYDVVPPVQQTRSKRAPPTNRSRRTENAEDSWDESDSGSDGDNDQVPPSAAAAAAAPTFPMVIYPMIVSMPPQYPPYQPQDSRRRKRKTNHGDVPGYAANPIINPMMNQIVNPMMNPMMNPYQNTVPASPHRPRKRAPRIPAESEEPSRYSQDDFREETPLSKRVEESPLPKRVENSPLPKRVEDSPLPKRVEQTPLSKRFHQRSNTLEWLFSDPLKDFLDDIFEDVIAEEAIAIFREFARKNHPSTPVPKPQPEFSMMDNIFDRTLRNIESRIAQEVIVEVLAEKVADEMIIRPVVETEVANIVRDTVPKNVAEDRRNNHKQMETMVRDKIVESMFLDYMVGMFSKQNQAFTKEDSANKMLDDMLLSVLFQQHNNVRSERSATLNNRPLRSFHEKAVTDVALDVVTAELVQSLDEDMADLDQFEQGFDST